MTDDINVTISNLYIFSVKFNSVCKNTINVQ